MINYIKKNSVIISYILITLSDTIFDLTEKLDLTNNQLLWVRAIGAIIAVISTQYQAILNENK